MDSTCAMMQRRQRRTPKANLTFLRRDDLVPKKRPMGWANPCPIEIAKEARGLEFKTDQRVDRGEFMNGPFLLFCPLRDLELLLEFGGQAQPICLAESPGRLTIREFPQLLAGHVRGGLLQPPGICRGCLTFEEPLCWRRERERRFSSAKGLVLLRSEWLSMDKRLVVLLLLGVVVLRPVLLRAVVAVVCAMRIRLRRSRAMRAHKLPFPGSMEEHYRLLRRALIIPVAASPHAWQDCQAFVRSDQLTLGHLSRYCSGRDSAQAAALYIELPKLASAAQTTKKAVRQFRLLRRNWILNVLDARLRSRLVAIWLDLRDREKDDKARVRVLQAFVRRLPVTIPATASAVAEANPAPSNSGKTAATGASPHRSAQGVRHNSEE